MAEKVRTFIAVCIPAELKRKLSEVEKKLALSGADVKWVAESNFHITLKFLGDVDSNRMSEVSSAVESAVRGTGPFEVEMSGVGTFPGKGLPRVVWVGISSGGNELKALAGKIDAELEKLGFAWEPKPFSPHITMGRTRSPRNAGQLQQEIDRIKDVDAGSFRVEELFVMKSELQPSGSVYTRIAEIRLY